MIDYLWNIIDPAVYVDTMKPKIPLWKRLFGVGR